MRLLTAEIAQVIRSEGGGTGFCRCKGMFENLSVRRSSFLNDTRCNAAPTNPNTSAALNKSRRSSGGEHQNLRSALIPDLNETRVLKLAQEHYEIFLTLLAIDVEFAFELI